MQKFYKLRELKTKKLKHPHKLWFMSTSQDLLRYERTVLSYKYLLF